jgi:protein-tyrosine phosphatase
MTLRKGGLPLSCPEQISNERPDANLGLEDLRIGKNQKSPRPSPEKERPVISRRLLTRIGGLLEGNSEERIKSRSLLLTLPDYPRILVVCHGNLCRSPAAEGFLKRQLSSRRFEVSSGGLSHQENLPTPSDFVREGQAFGLDLSTHRSRTVSPLLAEWADLILVMDRSNRDLLLDFGEGALRKCAWLGAWDSGPLEIPDPFGTTSAVMSQILVRLSRASEALAKELSARFPAQPDSA